MMRRGRQSHDGGGTLWTGENSADFGMYLQGRELRFGRVLNPLKVVLRPRLPVLRSLAPSGDLGYTHAAGGVIRAARAGWEGEAERRLAV